MRRRKPPQSSCCRICRTRQRTLTTHHIHPRRAGGEDDKRNLVCLCVPCHALVERFYWEHVKKHWPDLAAEIQELMGAVLLAPSGEQAKVGPQKRQLFRKLAKEQSGEDWPALFQSALEWVQSVRPTVTVDLRLVMFYPRWWVEKRKKEKSRARASS